MSLFTPFEYSITEQPSIQCVLNPKYNFIPLDMFALRNKLTPLIQDLYGSDTEVTSFSEPFEGRMRILFTTEPPRIKQEDIVMLSETIAKYVEESLYNVVLLDLGKTLMTSVLIPNWWILGIIKHVQIPNTSIDGNFLYLDMSNQYENDEYVDFYQTIHVNLIDMLSRMYRSNYFVCESNFAEKWEMTSPENFEMPFDFDSLEVYQGIKGLQFYRDRYLNRPIRYLNKNYHPQSLIEYIELQRLIEQEAPLLPEAGKGKE